jgi:hypothetical protein
MDEWMAVRDEAGEAEAMAYWILYTPGPPA